MLSGSWGVLIIVDIDGGPTTAIASSVTLSTTDVPPRGLHSSKHRSTYHQRVLSTCLGCSSRLRVYPASVSIVFVKTQGDAADEYTRTVPDPPIHAEIESLMNCCASNPHTSTGNNNEPFSRPHVLHLCLQKSSRLSPVHPHHPLSSQRRSYCCCRYDPPRQST